MRADVAAGSGSAGPRGTPIITRGRVARMWAAVAVGIALGPGNGPLAEASWTAGSPTVKTGSMAVSQPSYTVDGSSTNRSITSALFTFLNTDYAQVKNTGTVPLAFTGTTSVSGVSLGTGNYSLSTCNVAFNFLGGCSSGLLSSVNTTLNNVTGLNILGAGQTVAPGATKYIKLTTTSITIGSVTTTIQAVLPTGGTNRTAG